MIPVNKLSTKPKSKVVKRAAIELWKAIVPLAYIRKQLNMPQRTLHKILDNERQKSLSLHADCIPDRKKSSGQRLHESMPRGGGHEREISNAGR
jgi:hypothetical protein